MLKQIYKICCTILLMFVVFYRNINWAYNAGTYGDLPAFKWLETASLISESLTSLVMLALLVTLFYELTSPKKTVAYSFYLVTILITILFSFISKGLDIYFLNGLDTIAFKTEEVFIVFVAIFSTTILLISTVWKFGHQFFEKNLKRNLTKV
ncbi:MAG: hypothetical protein ACRCUP_04070 [Mycoplasmatales bacterium]